MKPKVGRHFTSERGEGVMGEVKNISLHWLQGIFETVPYSCSEYRMMNKMSINFDIELHIVIPL